MNYLIIVVEFLKVPLRDEISHNLIAQSDPIVEVSEPDHGIMICDRPILLKS